MTLGNEHKKSLVLYQFHNPSNAYLQTRVKPGLQPTPKPTNSMSTAAKMRRSLISPPRSIKFDPYFYASDSALTFEMDLE